MNFIVLLGPTCTGKTSLAEKLCLKFNGEIVSADSRQIYRYMDIGTGKKSLAKQRGLKHPSGGDFCITPEGCVSNGIEVKTHLQDLITPDQPYSVAQWVKEAQTVLKDIWCRGKVPFVVGGTGFYIDVLLGLKKTAGVAPDYNLRESLEALSATELFERLKRADPERASAIDSQNKRRLVRALEVAEFHPAGGIQKSLLGQVNLDAVKVHPAGGIAGGMKPLIFGLRAENELLYERADAWVEKILENDALLKETAQLLEMGYGKAVPLQGIIYRAVLDYFEHKLVYDEMRQRIKWDLHGYIRRQLTWFKKSPPGVDWFNIAERDYGKQVEDCVESWMKKAC